MIARFGIVVICGLLRFRGVWYRLRPSITLAVVSWVVDVLFNWLKLVVHTLGYFCWLVGWFARLLFGCGIVEFCLLVVVALRLLVLLPILIAIWGLWSWFCLCCLCGV